MASWQPSAKTAAMYDNAIAIALRATHAVFIMFAAVLVA